jgi:hydrogenase-4 component G
MRDRGHAMGRTMTGATWPLGAYAAGDEVRYLTLEPDGPAVAARAQAGDAPLPARSVALPALAWDEREMAQERGVSFADLPDPRPLFGYEGAPPPSRGADGIGLTHFVVGPVHAGIIEPGRFSFSSGGETVVSLDTQLGYAHRGIERFLEGRSALAAAPHVARICGSCSAARSHAYALALERLAGVVVPGRVALARLVVCELERFWNHVGDLAMSAGAAGWAPGSIRGLSLKEAAVRLCALATGHRLGFDAIVPGGVSPATLSDRPALRAALERFASDLEGYLRALFGNASVLSRWRHTGVVTHEVARAFALVGPTRRAVGDPLDVRSFAPYGAYRDVAVAPIVAHGGDVFARCAVKRDELRASLALVRDALTALDGVDLVPAPSEIALPRGTTMASVEGPRGAETAIVHVDGDGRIARFHLISASFRTWPALAHAMGDAIAPDFPLVNKSFNLCYACADR